MATPDSLRDESRTSHSAQSIALPIAMLMVAIVFGTVAVILIVFGVWPAVLLVIASAMLAAYAVRRIKREDGS